MRVVLKIACRSGVKVRFTPRKVLVPGASAGGVSVRLFNSRTLSQGGGTGTSASGSTVSLGSGAVGIGLNSTPLGRPPVSSNPLPFDDGFFNSPAISLSAVAIGKHEECKAQHDGTYAYDQV